MGLAPMKWTRDLWLRRFWQRSGCVVAFVGGWTGIATAGVSSPQVVADQPAEHFTAAAGGVAPLAAVLQDFAFEGGVERFGERVIGT